jgi:hypothetical protein
MMTDLDFEQRLKSKADEKGKAGRLSLISLQGFLRLIGSLQKPHDFPPPGRSRPVMPRIMPRVLKRP